MSARTEESTGGLGRMLLATDYQRGDCAWVDDLAERLITPGAPRCWHMRRRGRRAFVNAQEGHLRCKSCHVAHAGAVLKAQRPGTYGVGADGEDGCDRCRAHVAADLLVVASVHADRWVIFAALCPRCKVVFVREGRRGAASCLPVSEGLKGVGHVDERGGDPDHG